MALVVLESIGSSFDPNCISTLVARNQSLLQIPTGALNCKPCVSPGLCSVNTQQGFPPTSGPIYLTTNLFSLIAAMNSSYAGQFGCVPIGYVFPLTYQGVSSGPRGFSLSPVPSGSYQIWNVAGGCSMGSFYPPGTSLTINYYVGLSGANYASIVTLFADMNNFPSADTGITGASAVPCSFPGGKPVSYQSIPLQYEFFYQQQITDPVYANVTW